MLFVRKKDCILRLCIDYRDLNNVIEKNKYPLQHIDEFFDSLQGSKSYSKMDLRQGHYQLQNREDDIPNTAFNTSYDHYKFSMMLFGLKYASAAFMGLMHCVIQLFLDKFVVIFINYIHEGTHTLSKKNSPKTKKIQLHAENMQMRVLVGNVSFLGHIISGNGLEVLLIMK